MIAPGSSAPGDPAEGLSVAAVARRLGVAPATLRTWDRRYGLGPSTHDPGAHRRYSPADVARLESMRRLLLQGVGTASAAAAAVAGDRPEAEPTRPAGTAEAQPSDAEATSRGLLRAALAMDEVAVRALVRSALERHGLLKTWHAVLCPALTSVGERWEATGQGVEVEHLLAEVVGGELRAARPTDPPPAPVLLACPDGDYHSLPLLALAAALAERGVGARMLGGSVPAAALTAAVLRTGPAVTVLYAQLAVDDVGAALGAIPVTRPPVSVVLGGPGWGAAAARAQRADGLGSAVAAVLAGLGRLG